MAALAWAVCCAAQTADIQEAARVGDCARISALLAVSPDLVSSRDEDGSTPLHTAAMIGHMDAVLLLLERGADPDARNSLDQSPLLYAAYGGHAAIVDTLIARGAPFDCRDARGFAPIHFAAREGHADVVDLLVSKGAAFDTRGAQGRTPLHLAAAYGRADVVRFLAARGAKLDARDDGGATPMSSALGDAHAAAAEALLDAGAPIEGEEEPLTSYLHLAARAGSARLVDTLIARGARLDGIDEAGRTLLHDAAIGGLDSLAMTVCRRSANVNAVDTRGRTALHYAVSAGRPGMARLLLERGADPNLADKDARTPLHIAEDEARPEIETLLRSMGARDTERRIYSLSRNPSTRGRQVKGAPLEITYIGNEGFLIARGGKKVLIDAPQTNPWTYTPTGERIFSMMLENRPPLDGIEVCVASHAHADHINPRMAVELLKRRSKLVFVSSPMVCDSLRIIAGKGFGALAKRVVCVDPEWKAVARLRRRGIDFEFFGVNHAGPGEPPYKTLATVVDLGGIRVAHLADEVAQSNLENYEAIDLAREGIDIAFVDRGFFDSAGRKIVDEHIKPVYMILMHARPNEVEDAERTLAPSFPNLLLFHEQLEKKLFR